MKRPPAHVLTHAKQEVAGSILYVADAASYLGCSQKAVRSKVDRRLLPFRRLGGRVVFVRSELEAFITSLPGTTLAEAQANLALRHGEEVRR